MSRSAHRCYLLSLSELALLRSLDCLFCCVREVNDLNLAAVSRECLRHPAFALKVGRRHPPNQFTHFTLDPRPACFRPAREKAPIQPESSTVPAHNGFWLHHDENFFPVVRKNSVRSRRAVLLHLSSTESRCGGLFPLDLHLDSGF